MLDRLGTCRFAHRAEQRFAFVAIGFQHAYLDQLVAVECAVDLGDDGRTGPFAADHHHRLERMRPRTQFAALLRAERRLIDDAVGLGHLRVILTRMAAAKWAM